MSGPKTLGGSWTLTRKEAYRGKTLARHLFLKRGPFSTDVGGEIIIGFDQSVQALTVTRASPGNQTAFLKPCRWCHFFSKEGKVTVMSMPNGHDVDYQVLVPLPVFRLEVGDEDLHFCQQLLLEITENGEMVQTERIYDKLMKTSTELRSYLMKTSADACPMYQKHEMQASTTVKINIVDGNEKARRKMKCTKCSNPCKGHKGPTGKLCNMYKS